MSAAAQAPAILVVDDDAFVLITLKRVTRDVPARMVFASNLKEAWAAVNAELPELVIADYRLPDGDGLGFIEKLQARHPGLKCVLHTGEAVSRTAVGLDIPVLGKPCPPETLRELILGVLNDLSAGRPSKS